MKAKPWLLDWLELRKPSLKPRTIESYKDLLDRYIIPVIGDEDVNTITPDQLRHLLAGIMAQGKSRTAELVYVVLRCAFNDLEANPMLKVKRPKHKQKSPDPWTDEQIEIYLNACQSHPQGLALSLALRLGLRRGEICGLRWMDVDFETGDLHIRNQRVTLATGETIDTSPKSETSIRDIPLPADLLQQLRKARGLPTAYVCPLTPYALDAVHRSLTRSLNVPYIPLHGLRHSMATKALRHGGNMKALQVVLGHASYSTTANRYTHPDRAFIKSTVDAATPVCYTV